MTNVRAPETITDVLALSGNIVAKLGQKQLAMLQLYVEQGRKVGVTVSAEIDGRPVRDFDIQMRRLTAGNRVVPIYLRNCVLQVSQESKVSAS